MGEQEDKNQDVKILSGALEKIDSIGDLDLGDSVKKGERASEDDSPNQGKRSPSPTDTKSIFIKGNASGAKDEKFFVSNNFVEKIFDEINAKQDTICDRIESKIERLTERVMSVIDIREKELP